MNLNLHTILNTDNAVNLLLQFIAVFHTKRTICSSHQSCVLKQTVFSLLCHCLLRTLLKASLTIENSWNLLMLQCECPDS